MEISGSCETEERFRFTARAVPAPFIRNLFTCLEADSACPAPQSGGRPVSLSGWNALPQERIFSAAGFPAAIPVIRSHVATP
jgi:hypothetical protein